MPPALQAYYSDYVTDATGQAVAGATASLYPVRSFPPGVFPTTAPATAPLATATTAAGGLFAFKGIPPDDYHVLVQYTPAGGTPQSVWRYGVAVAPHEEARRAVRHALGLAAPRTLSRLLGGLPVTILCLGDGVTVGYNATGVVSGGYVARLAAQLSAAFPRAEVVRYDPSGYATTLDAPIPAWTSARVGSTPPAPGAQAIAVINAGVSGDTALRALRRSVNLTAASWNPPPDLYVVALGLGEMSDDPTRAAMPADFTGHLTGLVAVLRANGAEAVLCTPHAGSPSVLGTVDDYAAAVRAVAATTGCGLIDLRELWSDHFDPAAPNDGYGAWLDTSAGDHSNPTDAGHAAIGDEVFRLLDPAGALPLPSASGAAWESVTILNTSALLSYTGAWTAHSDFAFAPLLASGREMRTSTPGDRLTVSARCGEIYMLCRRWHDGGQVAVTVDGAPLGTVDLYRALPASTVDVAADDAAMAPRERVLLASGLSDAVHTVTLQLAAAANPASGGTTWRFDALELARLRHGGMAVEGIEPLGQLQRGTVAVALSGAATGAATVTFPLSYASAPTVIAQSPNPAYYTVVSGVGADSATITLVQYAHAAVTDTQTVAWLAFG